MRSKSLPILLATITPALVGVFVFSLEMANANHIIRGLDIGSIAAGGSPPAKIQTTLEEHADTFLDNPLTLSDKHGFTAHLTPRELGLSVDTSATFSRAWEFGREGRFLSDLFSQLETFLSGNTVDVAARLDGEQFNRALDKALHPLDNPAQNATLRWDQKKKTFLTVPEQSGVIVDRAPIQAALLAAAYSLQAVPEIKLELVENIPTITASDLPDAQTQLNLILQRLPLTLQAKELTQVVAKEKVALWFLFIERRESERSWVEVSIDEGALQQFLKKEIAPKVDHPAVDAKFHVENGRVTTFAFAREGQTLELASSTEAIKNALLTTQAGDLPMTVSLTVTTEQPRIGNDAAEKLQIKELLAVGETNFKGSPANRIWNIKTGTVRFNGVLIAPGEEFSFVKYLGAVGPETGYKPELVIKQGKTIPEYGGGLCQVSTTAFRAAVTAGLPITERKNHAYIVKYYNPAGFDATIYPQHPDLRFVNDTPGYILIQTSVTGTLLRFEFYGSSDGRKTEIIGPKIYNQKPDGSAKATLTMKVTATDGTERSQTFNSTYKSPSLYPVSRRNPLE